MWNQFNTQGYQNPGFPAGYQPAQMWNPQAYQQQMGQQTPQNQPQSKLVEALPVDSLEDAEHCPMAQGSSALFFARDDSFIATKRVDFNGNVSFEVYDKRPPAPPAQAPDFCTRAEVEEMIAAAIPKRTVKKEAAAE